MKSASQPLKQMEYGAIERGDPLSLYDICSSNEKATLDTLATKTTTRRIFFAICAAVIVSVIGLVVLSSKPSSLMDLYYPSSLSTKKRSSQSFSTSASVVAVAEVTGLEIKASDEYGDTSLNKFAYPFLDGALLASPYKTTTFTLSNTQATCQIAWSIKDGQGETLDAGVAVDSKFSTSSLKATGPHKLTVTEFDCSNNGEDERTTANKIQKTLWVKYVRRELSTLTDADREAFLDAFATLWKVNTMDGQELYGSAYKSLYYLAVVHNDAGANSVCDEFHGDQGFANNHLMLGSYLEQSLQLVDPSTCLHYLEYAKYFESDAFTTHLENQLDGGAWTDILTSKWFGANDPYTGRIIDGRWENASVPRLDSTFYAQHSVDPEEVFFPNEKRAWLLNTDMIHMRNPYGLLRSPWNWNPNPYVARFNNVNMIKDISTMSDAYRDFYSGVTCDDFEGFLTEAVADQPFSKFLKGAEDNVHGKIHFTFGGAGGEYADATNLLLQEHFDFSDSYLMLIAQGAQTFVKKLYPTYENRAQYGSTFPFNCTTFPWDPTTETLLTEAEPGEEGALCTINSYYCESQDNMKEFYFKYLSPFQTESLPQYSLEKYLLTLDLDTQCKIAGELVSRAAYDGEMAGSGAAMDPLFWVAHGAVERLMQKVIFSGLASDTTYDVTGTTCSGHSNDGTKYWLKGFHFADVSVVAEEVTNEQLNTFLNPTTTEYRDYFDFVYDSADYDFCTTSSEWFSR